MNELRSLRDQLEDLALRLDEEDSQVIQCSLEELRVLEVLQSDLQSLNWDFEAVERQYARDVKEFPNGVHVAELASSARAISRVVNFLDQRAPSPSMTRLKAALAVLIWGGAPPGMFKPMPIEGRRPDGGNIQAVKGLLAGLMTVKQTEGLSRHEAAKWIAQNISPALAERISKQPITGRTVEEWRDRYGGDHPPDDLGGNAFRVWSRSIGKQLTTSNLRQMTEQISERLPSLA